MAGASSMVIVWLFHCFHIFTRSTADKLQEMQVDMYLTWHSCLWTLLSPITPWCPSEFRAASDFHLSGRQVVSQRITGEPSICCAKRRLCSRFLAFIRIPVRITNAREEISYVHSNPYRTLHHLWKRECPRCVVRLVWYLFGDRIRMIPDQVKPSC